MSYIGKKSNSRAVIPMKTVTKVRESKKVYNRKKIKQQENLKYAQ